MPWEGAGMWAAFWQERKREAGCSLDAPRQAWHGAAVGRRIFVLQSLNITPPELCCVQAGWSALAEPGERGDVPCPRVAVPSWALKTLLEARDP